MEGYGIVAVLPVLRPPLELPARLTALVADLGRAGSPIAAPVAYVVDDGSPCTADPVLRACAAIPGVRVLRHRRTRGIAAALNTGVHAVLAEPAVLAATRAVLTLDQDSVLEPGSLAALVRAWRAATDAGLLVGAVAARDVRLPSGPLHYRERPGPGGTLLVTEALQSGTLWPLDSLRAIGTGGGWRGPFDESLGIDGVDTEACLRLAEHGRPTVLARGARLGHDLGAARRVRLLGRDVLATGHGPERRYTIARNRIRLAGRLLRADPVDGLLSLRRLAVGAALAVTVEDRRAAKAVATGRGLADGLLRR